MSTTSAAHPNGFPRGFKTLHPGNAFKIEGLRRFPIVYCLVLNGRVRATRSEKPSGQPGLSGTGRFRFGGVYLRAYRCGAGALSLATAFVSAVVGPPGFDALL